MAKSLLPLCSIKKITTRDGYVGALARLYLPFFGYWFAGGQQISENNTAGNIAQNQSLTMTGQVKPNVFEKSATDLCGDETGL